MNAATPLEWRRALINTVPMIATPEVKEICCTVLKTPEADPASRLIVTSLCAACNAGYVDECQHCAVQGVPNEHTRQGGGAGGV